MTRARRRWTWRGRRGSARRRGCCGSDPMTIELRFEPRDGYLSVAVSGRFELAEAQAATARVIQACEAQQQWKALLDIRAVTGQPTDTERFRYGESVAAQVLAVGQRAGASLRLAYVGHVPVIDP